MIFTLVPLFIANVLGAGTVAIGLVGGLSESVDAIFRIFSGRISDRFRKREILAVIGYGISTAAKPFMYVASFWGEVLAVRFIDRIGKGTRSSPRDALIADSVAKGERGKAFGIHRAMDSSGAVIGLAVAALIIYVQQGGGLDLNLKTYQWLVIAGVIPAVISVIVLLIFVHEKKKDEIDAPPVKGAPSVTSGSRFDIRFVLFLAVMVVFTLGNSSDFFVILRAQNLGTSVLYITLMLVLFNITYVLVSVPAGMLSDK